MLGSDLGLMECVGLGCAQDTLTAVLDGSGASLRKITPPKPTVLFKGELTTLNQVSCFAGPRNILNLPPFPRVLSLSGLLRAAWGNLIMQESPALVWGGSWAGRFLSPLGI